MLSKSKTFFVIEILRIVIEVGNIMPTDKSLTPLIKYPGGKTSELPIIVEYLPKEFKSYIEPFVGGGAVYFHLNQENNFINDKSEELMLLYEYVKTNNRTFYMQW